jgi:predicted dehydrogenase
MKDNEECRASQIRPGHVLICGLGSIGRRHLRHLRAMGVPRVDAFRTGTATLPDEGQPPPDHVYKDLGAALDAAPQVVVISNPTSLHIATARAAICAGCHVLVEKPLSNNLEGIDALKAEVEASGRVLAIGCNLRFHPMLQMVRRWIQIPGTLGRPRHARIHFHAFLPAWHPWEDYRTSYAARRDLGGGAALTHIHEIDYALWLFGPADIAMGLAAKDHPLGTDVDEYTGLLIRHASGVTSSLSLSICTGPPSRGFEIAFDEGTVRGDLISNRWTVFRADGLIQEGSLEPDFNIDLTYRLQLERFFETIEGKVPGPEVGIAEGSAALRIALCPGRA